MLGFSTPNCRRETNKEMPTTAQRLFKLLLVATKELRQKSNAVLLQEFVNSLRPQLEKLSISEHLFDHIQHNPTATLRSCFRKGTSSDVVVLVAMIPELFRYTRSAKLILDSGIEKWTPRLFPIQNMRSPYNLSASSLLLSKLYFMQAELQHVNLDEIFNQFLFQATSFADRVLKEELQANGEGSFGHASKPARTLEEQRRQRVFSTILVFDRLHRNYIYHNVQTPQVMFPTYKFQSILSPSCRDYFKWCNHLTVFAHLINDLPEYGMEAYGALIDDRFYLKVIPKPRLDSIMARSSELKSRKANSRKQPALQPQPDGVLSPTSSSSSSSTSTGASTAPSTSQVRHTLISAMDLHGQHFFSGGYYEIVLQYHPTTQTLEAVMHLDPNTELSENKQWMRPKGSVLWRVNLSQFQHSDGNKGSSLDTKHLMYLDRDYQGVETRSHSEEPSHISHVEEEVVDENSDDIDDDMFEDDDQHLHVHKNKQKSTSSSSSPSRQSAVPKVCFIRLTSPPNIIRLKQMLPHLSQERLEAMEAVRADSLVPLEQWLAEQSTRSPNFHYRNSRANLIKYKLSAPKRLHNMRARVAALTAEEEGEQQEVKRHIGPEAIPVQLPDLTESHSIYQSRPRYMDLQVRKPYRVQDMMNVPPSGSANSRMTGTGPVVDGVVYSTKQQQQEGLEQQQSIQATTGADHNNNNNQNNNKNSKDVISTTSAAVSSSIDDDNVSSVHTTATTVTTASDAKDTSDKINNSNASSQKPKDAWNSQLAKQRSQFRNSMMSEDDPTVYYVVHHTHVQDMDATWLQVTPYSVRPLSLPNIETLHHATNMMHNDGMSSSSNASTNKGNNSNNTNTANSTITGGPHAKSNQMQPFDVHVMGPMTSSTLLSWSARMMELYHKRMPAIIASHPLNKINNNNSNSSNNANSSINAEKSGQWLSRTIMSEEHDDVRRALVHEIVRASEDPVSGMVPRSLNHVMDDLDDHVPGVTFDAEIRYWGSLRRYFEHLEREHAQCSHQEQERLANQRRAAAEKRATSSSNGNGAAATSKAAK